jgi:AcrR family transcriptional regulator
VDAGVPERSSSGKLARVTTESTHRADFARNERRILDAAARVHSERPSPGMSGIAAEAGVGRATLYRHFATRDELIAALETELLDAAGAIIAQQSVRTDMSAADALGQIVEDLVEVRARYRLLFDWPDREEANRRDAGRRFDAPLLALIERGQREGGLDPEVPPRWILIALAGLTRRALKGYTDGEIELDDAKQLARRGLLRGFGA